MTSKRKVKISKAIYKDSRATIDERVLDLLGRMTLTEKVQQMTMSNAAMSFMRNGKFSSELARKIFNGVSIGALEYPKIKPSDSAELINAIQMYLKSNTRLGIPVLVISECLHGFMAMDATVFPQAIGLGSTWNTELLYKIASVIAKEARSVGVAQALSPGLDLAKDPRWGRVEEAYGEDTYLVSQMGIAYIKGMQGSKLKVDREHLIATAKAFVHGSPEGGLNLSPAAIGPRELREVYFPPFKAAVEAGVLSVMPSYNEIDGIPCSSSKILLREILRKEWGFQGYTFSDYGAIPMLRHVHRTASSLTGSVKLAVEAGMDMDTPCWWGYGKKLPKLVESGQISIELINQAVSRILRVKFLAGLFENPFAEPKRAVEIINHPKHRKLAHKAAQESIILLKNTNNLLPLDKGIKSIAVIGPNADIAQLGNYCINKPQVVTPLQGIRNAVSRNTHVSFAKGCGIYELSKDAFGEAVETALKSEVAVLVVGGASMTARGLGWGTKYDVGPTTCGEGLDQAELNLLGVQQELVEAVAATGTPTIVVLVNGRPDSITWISEHVPAILEAWYPGEEGGNALADILFGKVNPSGKLPVSIPRSVGQLPIFYNRKPSARGHYHAPGSPGKPGHDYVFMPTSPLYEFGHGLSYTTFKYSNLRVTPKKIGIDENVKVSVTVRIRNTGKRQGKEVVQLYINDLVSSVTTPVKVLRGFKKISLKPGQSKTVNFILDNGAISLLNHRMERIVEPGKFKVMVDELAEVFEICAL